MSEINIFQEAARKKLRFPSVRGDLMVEQLYDLPLTAANGFSLDAIARAINTELKGTEESFVDAKPDPRKSTLTLQLDLVKSVIATKQAEAAAIAQRRERNEKRAKLLDVLERKENSELEGLSKDEILKRLEELDPA